jgi:hypothetical protein
MLQPELCSPNGTGSYRPVVKQQFLDSLIDKGDIQRREITWLGFQQNVHCRTVCVAEKPL